MNKYYKMWCAFVTWEGLICHGISRSINVLICMYVWLNFTVCNWGKVIKHVAYVVEKRVIAVHGIYKFLKFLCRPSQFSLFASPWHQIWSVFSSSQCTGSSLQPARMSGCSMYGTQVASYCILHFWIVLCNRTLTWLTWKSHVKYSVPFLCYVTDGMKAVSCNSI